MKINILLEDSFYYEEIKSVNFGENSNLKTIGNYVFDRNKISTLTISNSVTTMDEYAFYLYSYPLILIKKQKKTFWQI